MSPGASGSAARTGAAKPWVYTANIELTDTLL